MRCQLHHSHCHTFVQPINSAYVSRPTFCAAASILLFSLPLRSFISPKMSSNSGSSYNNPLPYPDRRRPGRSQPQQYDMGQAESTTAPPTAGGGLPYPNRPARYQDYVQTSQPSHPPPQSSSPSYEPPGPQQKVKPAAPPQPVSGTWPTAPTAYNDPVGGYGSSGTFAMGDVAASLPSTNTAPTQAAQTYPISSPPPVPGKVALPPSPSVAPIIPQFQQPAASTAQTYDGRYAPGVPTAGVAAASAHQYLSTQSPHQQQQPIQPPVSSISPNSSSYGQPHVASNVAENQHYRPPSPVSTVPPQQPPLSPVPTTTTPGYVPPPAAPCSTPQDPQYTASGTNPPPAAYQQTPAISPTPSQPGYVSPPQITTQPYTPQPPATTPVVKSEYMSVPPPIPGTAPATSFPPPPPTYNPGQPTPPNPVPSYPGQPGTVRIDGKDHPIPAFVHTIQTPSQCEPALKEAYFGPYLRFKNVDLQHNLWLGSVLLVLPSQLPPPQLEFHPSGDFSRLQAAPFQQIYTYDNYSFVRYDLVIPIGPVEQKWTYAITTQGTQTWEFLVAGQQERWRFIAWSCNDFSASVKKEERDKLGFGTVWKNVNERHAQEGGFHAQLGGGDQIYADRMWNEIP